jgi:hypothetical protein
MNDSRLIVRLDVEPSAALPATSSTQATTAGWLITATMDLLLPCRFGCCSYSVSGQCIALSRWVPRPMSDPTLLFVDGSHGKGKHIVVL